MRWCGMLPGEDEEAVETAEDGEEDGRWKQGETERGFVGNGRDEDCGGEEDAYSDLLWKPVGFGLCRRGAVSVNEEKVAEEESPEDEIKVYGLGRKLREEAGKSARGEEDAEAKGALVVAMEVVAGFEAGGAGGRGLDGAGVE